MGFCNNCNNSGCGANGISVSSGDTRHKIEIDNDKSRYYAERAKASSDKAWEYSERAKYYSEQNSNVSMEDINTLDSTLRNLIDGKQAVIQDLETIRSGAGAGATAVQPADIGNATITLTQDNSTIGSFSTNQKTASTINIDLTDKANTTLSNLSAAGDARLHAIKCYLDEGELLTDAQGLANVKSYAHSTFDLSKFTVVGSPTVSDGVMSNFSSSNYVSQSISINANSNYTITGKFTVSTLDSESVVIELCSSSTVVLSLRTAGSNNGVVLISRSTGGENESIYAADITTGNAYEYKISVNGSNVSFYLNGETVGSVSDYDSLAITTISVGAQDSGSNPFTGSIDLKQLSIKVGGIPVFCGNTTGTDSYTINGSTVLVPYILSKTGSKIVDSAYRTQVASVYNVQGYAPYYTLSDTDFTLPMGEIYGSMIDKSAPHTVETHVNGTSWYRIYSDGWCEQGGMADHGSNAADWTQSVTFLKEFTSSDYTAMATPITTAGKYAFANTSDLTTTGMTVCAYRAYGTGATLRYCSWYVCGYIA